MREIKFREWDHNREEMYGKGHGMSYGEREDFDDIVAWRFAHTESLGEEPRVLMQYTGLNDSNGREIYENDILRIYNPENGEEINEAEIVEVKWCIDYDYPAFDIPDSVESSECNGLSQALNDGSIVEVIGNRFEDPSLLKKKANSDE